LTTRAAIRDRERPGSRLPTSNPCEIDPAGGRLVLWTSTRCDIRPSTTTRRDPGCSRSRRTWTACRSLFPVDSQAVWPGAAWPQPVQHTHGGWIVPRAHQDQRSCESPPSVRTRRPHASQLDTRPLLDVTPRLSNSFPGYARGSRNGFSHRPQPPVPLGGLNARLPRAQETNRMTPPPSPISWKPMRRSPISAGTLSRCVMCIDAPRRQASGHDARCARILNAR
jgi:hypothetical protein